MDDFLSFPLSYEEYKNKQANGELSEAQKELALDVILEYMKLTSGPLAYGLSQDICWTLAVTRVMSKMRRIDEECHGRKQELIGFLKELGVAMPLLEEK